MVLKVQRIYPHGDCPGAHQEIKISAACQGFQEQKERKKKKNEVQCRKFSLGLFSPQIRRISEED